MTLAEQWFSQGEAKGAAKGEAKGHLDVLIKQLTLKFGEPSEQHRARLAVASPAEVDAWIERILFATTIEQVFGD